MPPEPALASSSRGTGAPDPALIDKARPVALAREQTLPVLGPLTPLLPEGLHRGWVVGTGSSTSLALALAAGPAAAGSWVAAVGLSELGLAAAAELGVPLGRLVLIPSIPPGSWSTVVATLLDAFDVVLVRATHRVRQGDARRLAARGRERGAVLFVLDPSDPLRRRHGGWPEAFDVRLEITAAEWHGLGDGHGHLQGRRATVVATGRRAAARPRRAELWLPGPDGAVSPVVAEPTPLRAREVG